MNALIPIYRVIPAPADSCPNLFYVETLNRIVDTDTGYDVTECVSLSSPLSRADADAFAARMNKDVAERMPPGLDPLCPSASSGVQAGDSELF